MKNKQQPNCLTVGSDKMQYHSLQHKEPYRSTVSFVEFIKKFDRIINFSSDKVVDVACGMAGSMLYIKNSFPKLRMVGLEKDQTLVDKGNAILKTAQIDSFVIQSDVFDLDSKKLEIFGKIDGVFSLQFLLYFHDYEAVLKQMLKFRPKWIALSALFCEGPFTYKVEVTDHNVNEIYPYIMISIPEFSKTLARLGCELIDIQRFVIDIELPKPENNRLLSYTQDTVTGERIEITGAMLMPWYNVFIKTEFDG